MFLLRELVLSFYILGFVAIAMERDHHHKHRRKEFSSDLLMLNGVPATYGSEKMNTKHIAHNLGKM